MRLYKITQNDHPGMNGGRPSPAEPSEHGPGKVRARVLRAAAGLLGAACILLSACSGKNQTESWGFFKKIFSPETYRVYTTDIPQGNFISREKTGRLKLGMKKDQVGYLLGTPLTQNVFRRDRWDYVYYVRKDGRPRDRRRVTLYFEGDRLVRIIRYRPDKRRTAKDRAPRDKERPAAEGL